MRYNCGHDGCDICGARRCKSSDVRLQKIGDFLVCESCVRLSVKVAYNMSATFGGTIIDVSKQCTLIQQSKALNKEGDK